MNVFIATPSEHYSGGCIIIAANTLEEAQFISEKQRVFEGSYNVTEMTELQTTRTTSGVIAEYTYFE